MTGAEIYKPCDRAIQAMNRDMVKGFGQLKAAKFDELNVIRTVRTLYRKSAKEAEWHYFEVATEAYVLGLMMCGMDSAAAHRKAGKGITIEWVRERLEETNPVTLYRFGPETERKAERLSETLTGLEERTGRELPGKSVTADTNAQIDSAMKAWSRQLGQYAIDITDLALMKAFEDAGIKEAEWVTARDEKVCHDCRAMDGKIFPLERFPAKPHYGCRCRRAPVRKQM